MAEYLASRYTTSKTLQRVVAESASGPALDADKLKALTDTVRDLAWHVSDARHALQGGPQVVHDPRVDDLMVMLLDLADPRNRLSGPKASRLSGGAILHYDEASATPGPAMSTVTPIAAPASTPVTPATTGGTNGLDKKSALFQFMLNQLLNPPNVLTDAGGTSDDEDDGSVLSVQASGFPVL